MNKVVSAIFAVYVAAFIYANAFFVKSLTMSGAAGATLFWNHLAIFAVLFVGSYFILSKYVSTFGGNLSFFIALLALIGLLIAIFTHLIPVNPVYNPPSFLSTYFASSIAYTCWLVAPVVVLFF